MTYIQRIPELPGAGRLGRHAFYDPRRTAYPYLAPTVVPVVSVRHTRHIGILDQGDLGSCTGNMMTGAAATSPVFDALPAGHATLNEALAVGIYSDAEKIDGGAGYPPEDQGSTGQSVSKAAQARGLISGYLWATNVDAVLAALMNGPVGFGINWYSSFDTPGPDGVVSLPSTATIRGGHEVVSGEVDATRELIWIDNSWGSAWGLAGRAAFPYAVIARLLSEDGDCVVPQPASIPPPAPVPVPPVPDVHVDIADLALAAAVTPAWRNGFHVGETGRVATAISTWWAAKKIPGKQ